MTYLIGMFIVSWDGNAFSVFNAEPVVSPIIHKQIIISVLEEANIDVYSIAPTTVPDTPSWLMPISIILYNVKVSKKSETFQSIFQGLFHNVQDIYNDHQFIFTDGSRDDQKVGCAFVSERQVVKLRLPDMASIFTAELTAIKLALVCIQNSDRHTFVICINSLSCLQTIEQLNIDHPLVLDILNRYTTLWSRHKYVKVCWVPSHLGIQGNERADKSAKAAMNELPSIMTIPFSDYKPYIHTYIRKKWLDFWDNKLENKCHSVQPTLGCWPLSSRRNQRAELVLSRIRIGHSYLTHRHLLVGEYPPECVSCQEVSQIVVFVFSVTLTFDICYIVMPHALLEYPCLVSLKSVQ